MDDFDKFRIAVLDDATLQSALRDILDRDAFVQKTTAMAQERGFDVTAEDVKWALQDARRTWVERWAE